MAYKEFEVTKIYFSISEVAEMFNVSASLLRYWETEFDVLRPRKNRKGDRLYTQDDISKVKLIYHLVKERGFTLDGAKKQLKANPESTVKNAQVIESLKKLRSFLVEVRENLNEAELSESVPPIPADTDEAQMPHPSENLPLQA